MTQRDKTLERWRTNTPTHEPVETVRAVMSRIPGFSEANRGDSHQLRIKHPALKEHPEFAPFGYLSVPVSSGQRVKGFYLRRIAIAARAIEEYEGSEGEDS